MEKHAQFREERLKIEKEKLQIMKSEHDLRKAQYELFQKMHQENFQMLQTINTNILEMKKEIQKLGASFLD